jgi:hypothetical protein
VWRVEPWEAGGDPGVRVLVKSLDGGLLEIVRAGAGGVELAEQGQGLAAHGLPGEGSWRIATGDRRVGVSVLTRRFLLSLAGSELGFFGQIDRRRNSADRPVPQPTPRRGNRALTWP